MQLFSQFPGRYEKQREYCFLIGLSYLFKYSVITVGTGVKSIPSKMPPIYDILAVLPLTYVFQNHPLAIAEVQNGIYNEKV